MLADNWYWFFATTGVIWFIAVLWARRMWRPDREPSIIPILLAGLGSLFFYAGVAGFIVALIIFVKGSP